MMPKKTYKERERERRAAEILRVAGQMIRLHGYAHLNMDALAEAVGISKPTLYQHFKNKEDMVAQAVIHATRHLEEFMLAQAQESPLDRLEATMRDMIATQYDPEGFSPSLVMNQVMQVLIEHPELLPIRGRVEGLLHHWIAEGKQKGEIDPHMSSEVIINAVFTLTSFADSPDRPPLSPAARQEIIENIIQFFRQGVRKIS